MSRTIRSAALVAALATAAAVPAPAPAASKKVQCVKRGGDTVYRDRTLRVIQSVKHSKADADASTAKLTFCKPGSTATPKTLLTFANDLDASQILWGVTRGGSRYLAVETAIQTGTTDASGLYVYDLTTRKQTFAHNTEDGLDHVVTAGGGVALLEAGTLTAYDSTGQKALATGASALAASGDAVYWTAGGAAHAATLTGAAAKEL